MISRKTGGIVIVVLVFIFPIEGSSEFQITTDPSDQMYPAIYGDIVVWEDNRNGNWDIYGYNLLTEQEFEVTTETGEQQRPAIYGNIVVWVDTRNRYFDIYGYNVSTGQEFQVTADTSTSNQSFPAIYQDIVVWQDDRNGNRDIYGYYLSTREEFRITTDSSDQLSPAIYQDIVVWEDERNGDRDIYGYDLSTLTEFPICTEGSGQYQPAVYGDVVVWEDWRTGFPDIYGYNLSTNQEFQIATNASGQQIPTICGSIVVWHDSRHFDWDIYGYDLSTSIEFPICIQEGNQYYPAIYGNIVVWRDERNGNWDIYGSTVQALAFTIWVDKGCGGNYYVGETLTVYWEASHPCEINFWEIEPDGTKRKLTTQPVISGAGQGSRGWTLQDYGYGKRAIYAEAVSEYGSGSAECEFYVSKKVADIEVKVKDQYENPISGAKVLLDNTFVGSTDSSGVYTIREVEFGVHTITAVFEGVEKSRSIQVTSTSTQYIEIVLELKKVADIEVKVKDQNENPISGAKVLLDNTFVGSTDSSGVYTIQEVEFGVHTITVVFEGVEKSRSIQVTSTSTQYIEIVLEIHVSEKVADIEVKVIDEEGNPISGAQVLLDNTFKGSTDSSGVYIIQEVEFGEHTITAEFEGEERISLIHIAAASTQYINFIFPSFPGSVSIRVFNQKNEPIENAEIYIDGSKEGYTSEKGVFEASVSEGSHAVEARWQNEKIERQVEVKSNEETSVDLIINTPQPVPYEILAILAAIVVVVALFINANIRRNKEEEKKEEEKPHVLICPQCKNRIQKDWDTCPYCGARLQ